MRIRVRSGWPSNRMPNRSYVSRSGNDNPGYRSTRLAITGSSAGTCAMQRMRRLRVCDRKFVTTSKRSGSTPGATRRAGSTRWSTAVTSTHWSNDSSSRSDCATSCHRPRGTWRTGWVCERKKRTSGKRSISAAATSSSGAGAPARATSPVAASAPSLGIVSRASSSAMPPSVPRRRPSGRDPLVERDARAAGRAVLPPAEQLAVADLLVQREDPVQERLRAGRTAGHVHVHGHDLVDALDDRIVVEHPARARADAHRDDPLRLDHLVVDLTQDRGHLLAEATGDDHQVGLAGARPEDLHPEPSGVVVRGAGRHHLDRATGETEGRGPHRAALCPLDEILDARGQEVVRDLVEAHR